MSRFIYAAFQKNQTTKTSFGEIPFNAKGIASVTDDQAKTFLTIPGYELVNEDGSKFFEQSPEEVAAQERDKAEAEAKAKFKAEEDAARAARKELITRAKELGVKFPQNAKNEQIAELIDAKEKELAEARAEANEEVVAKAASDQSTGSEAAKKD